MTKFFASLLAGFVFLWVCGSAQAACMSVEKAQIILKHLNYFPETADGRLGPTTQKSIRTFQADYGLPVTGTLTAQTCSALQAEEEKILQEKERKRREQIVRRAQVRLGELGYYTGPASGRVNDIPMTDLVEFQESHGMEKTGHLDEPTLALLLHGTPHKKETPKPPAPEPPVVVLTKEPEPKPEPSQAPRFTWTVGGMSYQPKSLYDSTDYEAINETLNPEQAVSYDTESFVINRFSLDLSQARYYFATSRLTGGDNAADSLGGLWFFPLRDKPFVLSLAYNRIESDAVYDNRRVTLTTEGLQGEFLHRSRPGLAWGLSFSHENYPTLVSAKNKNAQFRSIRFDEDFSLSSFNLALRYNSLGAGKTWHIPRTRLVPYLIVGLDGGLSYGKVSGSVIDGLSSDLNHAFDDAVVRLNVAVAPEVGIKYVLQRKKRDLELTLGYGASARWPLWNLPQVSEDDEVDFYRRELSHGLVLGVRLVF